MTTSDQLNDIHDLISRINELRTKQLSGTDLSDDELKEGIRLLSAVRTLRAGKKANIGTDDDITKFF